MATMRNTFSRRGIIRRAAFITGGGAVAMAGFGAGFASAQAAKVAQTTAQYQATPKGTAQCSGCGSFIAPSACKLVAGTITPSGWCSLYNPKT